MQLNPLPGRGLAAILLTLFLAAASSAQEEEEYEPLASSDCVDCHEESDHQTMIAEDLSHSVSSWCSTLLVFPTALEIGPTF